MSDWKKLENIITTEKELGSNNFFGPVWLDVYPARKGENMPVDVTVADPEAEYSFILTATYDDNSPISVGRTKNLHEIIKAYEKGKYLWVNAYTEQKIAVHKKLPETADNVLITDLSLYYGVIHVEDDKTNEAYTFIVDNDHPSAFRSSMLEKGNLMMEVLRNKFPEDYKFAKRLFNQIKRADYETRTKLINEMKKKSSSN